MENQITFEAALIELEEIIKKLEVGTLPLDEAISAFERGTFLKKFCDEKLKNAQLKIETLMETTKTAA